MGSRKLSRVSVLTLTFLCVLTAPLLAFRLPDTDQRKCYQAASPYWEIGCSGTGQDGAYIYNQLSYTDNGNGTVTDNNTGLIWQQKDNGTRYNWYQASGIYDATYNPETKDVCGSLDLGGATDWRLPSKKELTSIVNFAIPSPGPTIAPVFTGTKATCYLSSTPYAGSQLYAWIVLFLDGTVYEVPKQYDYTTYVRCVRGGQTPGPVLIDNRDQTVTDTRTGLVWQQDEPGDKTWNAALSYCESRNQDESTDWRLPNIKELESLAEDTLSFPAIDKSKFPDAYTGDYWSSTSYARAATIQRSGSAWYVDFQTGEVRLPVDKSTAHAVRCVRGGHSGFVGSLNPTIAQTPMAAPAGTTFTQSGAGFTPNGSATLHFRRPDGTEYDPQPQALDSTGHFASTYLAQPDKTAGYYTWWAVDNSSSEQSNEVTYEITPSCTSGNIASIQGLLVDADTTLGIGLAAVAFHQGGVSVAQTQSSGLGLFTLSNLACGTAGELVVTAQGYAPANRHEYVTLRGDGSPVVRTIQMRHSTGTPVLLIPGIMGSGLGLGTADVLFPFLPKWTAAPSSLRLVKGPVKVSGWDELRGLLKINGFVPVDVPWDWRVPLSQARDIYLKKKIQEIREGGYLGKIPVVAHSMGGLLTRDYIQNDEGVGNLGPFAMVGTPNLGSSMPYYIWEGGSPLLADNVNGNGITYSAVLDALWYTEGYAFLFGPYYLATPQHIRFFVANEGPTLRQLMNTEAFLLAKSSGDFKTVSGGNVNQWLGNLNAGTRAKDTMSAQEVPGKVTTGIFIGGAHDTVQTIVVGPSKPMLGLWDDGIAVGRVLGAGDKTVPYQSARYPKTEGWARLDPSYSISNAEHSNLVGDYAQDICAFIKGSPCVKPAAALVATADPAGPQLMVHLSGQTHFMITDALGRRTGIDPVTLLAKKEIPGSEISFIHADGFVTLPIAADGTWTIALSGTEGPDVRLEVSSIDGESIQRKDIIGSIAALPADIEVTVTGGASDKIAIAEPHAAVVGVVADLYVAGSAEASRLTWNASAEPGVNGYRIYRADPAQPHFTRLASVDALTGQYDTGINWCSAAVCTPTSFAVVAVFANGEESFFSPIVMNNDRDHDGLSDTQEADFGTDRNDPDTDGDGFGDGVEVRSSTDPLDPAAVPFQINNGAEFTKTTAVTLELPATNAGGNGPISMRFVNNSGTASAWEPYQTAKFWTLAGGAGIKTVYAQFKDKSGKLSDSDPVKAGAQSCKDEILYDPTAPTGTILINNGAARTTTPAVTLHLWAMDTGGSGIDAMRLVNGGSTVGDWEPYATTKSWTLPSTVGTKTVWVQYRDKAGNISDADPVKAGAQSHKAEIIYDPPPTGTILINNGAASTNTLAVTLKLSATDTGSGGLDSMRFTNGGGTTVTDWEPYATTKSWTLTSGVGTKTVYVQYKDKAGNISDADPVKAGAQSYSDTIVYAVP